MHAEIIFVLVAMDLQVFLNYSHISGFHIVAGVEVTIESVEFPGVFLRMDGRGVNRFNRGGIGVVNSQFGADLWEKFSIQSEDVGYSIQSVAFPGVFLRMDGNGVNAFNPSGGGVVNGQSGAYSWEKFYIQSEDVGYSIKSVQFPGVFLRMDGYGVNAFNPGGGGVVNGQFGSDSFEQFKLHFISP